MGGGGGGSAFWVFLKAGGDSNGCPARGMVRIFSGITQYTRRYTVQVSVPYSLSEE